MANICFVSLKVECRSNRAALKVNAVLTQLKKPPTNSVRDSTLVLTDIFLMLRFISMRKR